MVKPSDGEATPKENTLVGNIFKPRELAQKSTERWFARNRSLVLRQTPVWAQSLTAIVVTLGLGTITAGILFRIDEVVTVTGQLESISGKVDVKTPAGGKVAAVLFEDGAVVNKGDLLVSFDTRQALSDKITYSKLIELEKSDLKDKLVILESRQQVLNKKVDTSEKIAEELGKLVAMGGFQKVQYLNQLDQLYELKTELSNIRLEKNRSKLESEKSVGQLSNRLKQAELRLQYQNVIAPDSGIVFEPKARVDGVLNPGDTILTIIPQKGLKAKVYVANKDIGFIKTNQKAQIRVDAFPFTQYGELEGVVKQIGADALPPNEEAQFFRYPVKINLNNSYLERSGIKIPLRSGMAITANLKLRDKRLISLLSDMLVDQTESIRGIRQQ